MTLTHTHEGALTRTYGFNAMDWIAMILMIIGGINWGLVGLADFNLVAAIFGDSALARIVYILVGVASLYGIFLAIRMAGRNAHA